MLIAGYPWFLIRKEKIPYGLIDCNGNYTIINKLLKNNKHTYLLFFNNLLIKNNK